MKQKAIRGALLVVVLAVWGAVIARVLHRPEGRPTEEPFTTDTGNVPVIGDHDTILVVNLSRDPFLDGSAPVLARRSSEAPRVSQPQKPLPPALPNSWPKLTYKGRMRNGDGGVVAFVQVSGKDEVLKEGTPIDGCVIASAGVDTLLLVRGLERHAYPRQ